MKTCALLLLMLASQSVFAATGQIKWYAPQRGFGFIVPSDGQADVLFMGQDFLSVQEEQSIFEGKCVEYDLGYTRARQPIAKNIRFCY